VPSFHDEIPIMELFMTGLGGSHRFAMKNSSIFCLALGEAELSSSGSTTGSQGMQAGRGGSSGDPALAASKKPALVDIVEIVTLQDGREIFPICLHLAPPAAPSRDPEISGLERALDHPFSVSVKPFFDLMRCHPHDPTSFLQEKSSAGQAC
jgi:hypothetical protein